MKMNDTVARIVEIMFQDVEMNEETAAIRDEVMDNCQERYVDMVNSGLSQDDAIAAVIESLKGMEDVLAPYKRKVQHTDDADADVESGERNLTFAAVNEIHKIDLCLVNEDVKIEPSDDDAFHVIWDAEENPLVQAYMQDGVLRVERKPGDADKMNNYAKVEYHHKGDMSDFVRTEDGKIEINMDGISRTMKSLGDKIKLMFSEGVKISIGSAKNDVTIQVPEYAIPHVKLLTTSGDIEVQNVSLADLNVTSTSGDIKVELDEDQSLKLVELRTTSGDIDVSAFTQGMTVASTSGDVEVEGRINLLAISTISGDIDVRADVKNITFKAISGDVDLQFDSDEIRDVRGSTISGDIDIDLPDGIGIIAISTQTRSGDVTTRHHTDGVGPTVTGSVSSMSGDITIS